MDHLMQGARGSAKPRLPGVDLLRGIAVLLVVLHHIHLRFVLNQVPVDDVIPRPLNQVLFWSGYYAVIAFFVISGFLITRLSLERWGELGRISIGRFYTLRAARIVPCLVLLLAILIALHLARAPDFTIKPDRASLTRAVLAALTFHINWLEGHHGYLPGGWDVLWSLSIEETFYLLFPLLCILLRREALLWVSLIALIIAGPLSRAHLAGQDPWADYAYLSCTDGIAFGCLVALVSRRRDLSQRTLRRTLAAGAALALTVIVCRNHEAPSAWASTGLDVTVLEAGVALMLLALGSSVGNRTLAIGTGWLRMIGQSSYEIYLFHMLVILGFIDLLRAMQPVRATLPFWYVDMLLVSVLLGYTVSRAYSEPLNRRLRGQAIRPVEPLTVDAVSNPSE